MLKKEKGLHGEGGLCQTQGIELQGLRGDVGRSGSSPQASEQQARMIQLCLTPPASESQIVAYSPSNYPLLHVFSACLWESSPATLN